MRISALDARLDVGQPGTGVRPSELVDPEIQVLRGAGIWARYPIMRIPASPELDASSSEQAGFQEALLSQLPGLRRQPCSLDVSGGFYARLVEGTPFGHVVSHVALELQVLAGATVPIGETCVSGARDPGDVIYGYLDEAVGREAGAIALEVIRQLSTGQQSGNLDLTIHHERLAAIAAQHALHRSSTEIVDRALSRGIPVAALDTKRHTLFQLGHGARQQRIRTTTTGRTSLLGANTALDKTLTNELLRSAGVPVPMSTPVLNAQGAVEAAEATGYPVVIKPRFGKSRIGVSIGLDSEWDVRRAYTNARLAAKDGHVVVERYVSGRDFRVLVMDGKTISVREYFAPQVHGDGKHTVKELVAVVNSDPRRGVGKVKPLSLIRLGPEVDECLARQDLDLQSVPEAGRPVQVALDASLAGGGTTVDRTAEIHPDIRSLAELATDIVGLDVAGVDIRASEIDVSLHASGGVVVEVNQSPGLRGALPSDEEHAPDPVGAYLDLLFPVESDGRIPIIAVGLAAERGSVAPYVGHILGVMGLTPGVATRDGLKVGGLALGNDDMSGHEGAGAALRNPWTDCAVLEVAATGIVEDGLGYDMSDVVVITPLDRLRPAQADRWTPELSTAATRVMVTAVPPTGTAIFDASDPLLRSLAQACQGSVLLCSVSGREGGAGAANSIVDDHCGQGGAAFVEEDDGNDRWVVLREAERRRPIVATRAIPALQGDHERADAVDVLTAAAATWALGARFEDIKQGLRTLEGRPSSRR